MNARHFAVRHRRSRRWAAALAAFGIWLVAPGTWAQSGSPMVTQHQLQVVEMRLEHVERLLDSGVLTEMLQGVEALQSEVRQLRGQVEELDNELRNLRTRQRDQFRNLDERMTMVEGGRSSPLGLDPEPDPLPRVAEALPPADEQRAYEAAFELLMSGNHDAAIPRLERFMEQFPNGSYSANALYWLGEAKYANRDYQGALVDFEAVRSRFRDSDKAADALLKVGYSHFELGNSDQARVALEEVVANYPGTTLSRLAQERLRRLDSQ